MTRTRAGTTSASEKRLAPGMATALDQAFAVGVVVVGDLLTAADVPRGTNPDDTAEDVNIRVRVAGVVDVARHVAADAGIDDRPVGELETPDVPVPDVAALAPEALLVGDLLAR